MKLGIYTTATSNHAYALTAQARALHSACVYAGVKKPVIALVCSDEDFVDRVKECYEVLFPKATMIVMRNEDWENLGGGKEYYKSEVQLMIGQMRTAGTKALLSAGCDRILSMDSDVLPPHNAISCMLDTLSFDKGYYGVAACPYPSQGGGAFLGGRGSREQPIFPDWYEDEKIIPDGLISERDELIKKHDGVATSAKEKTDSLDAKMKGYRDRIDEIEAVIKDASPKDNVFILNGKKWRRRGWFDQAYPAIGKGSMVPTDWVGFGCTMMNRDTAAMCDWSGYSGGGTEDLYICFHRWANNQVKIATIAHCPCDHIVRDRNNAKKFIHVQTFHEPNGECEGHLRQRNVPWYGHDVGEKFDEKNDGRHTNPVKEDEKGVDAVE